MDNEICERPEAVLHYAMAWRYAMAIYPWINEKMIKNNAMIVGTEFDYLQDNVAFQFTGGLAV